MTFVDCRRCFLKTLPKVFAKLLDNGTDFAPFVVKFLQFFESDDNVIFVGKRFSFFAKVFFRFEIFLKVKVSKLLVNLQRIIELLCNCLEFFPKRFVVGGRHTAYFFKGLLKLLELRIEFVHIVDIFCDFGKFDKNSAFALKVGNAFSFDGSQLSRLFLFIFVK